MIRAPYRAGSFYPAAAAPCRAEADAAIEAAHVPEDTPETIYGGLVPHAGWAFSGSPYSVRQHLPELREVMGVVLGFLQGNNPLPIQIKKRLIHCLHSKF